MSCCSEPGAAEMSSPFGLSDDSPVYVISVAAQLAGLHPQTLRYYDKLGLVSPGRSSGRGRRYSLRDVLALREIQRLSQEEGINLSGIKRILELQGELRRHQQRLTDVSAELAQLRVELESTRSVAARLAGLLRARSGGAQLVPVHDPAPGAGPPAARPERRALPIAARGRPDALDGPDEGQLPAAPS
jgi:MerR family transcriptional regulator, heat shock protein HspR